MINYQTILSNFNNKLTLMQWLNKVEDALRNGSLSSVEVSQPTETTAVFKFIFADGTYLESPELTLPRGEQGEQGEIGPQGPQGPQGIQGVQGITGESELITNVTVNASNELILTLSLAGATRTINGGTITVNPDLFNVIYNTTTFAEITNALSAGKLPVCIYNDRLYILASYNSSVYRFSSLQSDYIRYITVDNSNNWTSSSYNVELTSNKTTNITLYSTDTQFPSAKAVYNLLYNNLGTFIKPMFSNFHLLSVSAFNKYKDVNVLFDAEFQNLWNGIINKGGINYEGEYLAMTYLTEERDAANIPTSGIIVCGAVGYQGAGGGLIVLSINSVGTSKYARIEYEEV